MITSHASQEFTRKSAAALVIFRISGGAMLIRGRHFFEVGTYLKDSYHIHKTTS